MISGLRRYPQALLLSVLFHVGLLTLMFVSMNFDEPEKLVKQGERVKTVKAKVIDQQQLDAEKRKKEEVKRKAAEKKKKQAEAKKKKQAEVKKKEEQKKKKIAEEKRKKEQAKLKAEALEKKQAEEEKEKQRKLAEVKHQKEAEKRKAEDLRKAEEKKQAEEKRLAEDKKKAEAEKRRLAEEEQKRKQEDLRARLESEESQRKLSALRDAYRLAIKQKIERNWRRPQESGKMPDCEVRVLQGPGGIILDVTFGACSGGTNTYRASIENAVYKAEPLPKPGDPTLFERDLIIEFKPK